MGDNSFNANKGKFEMLINLQKEAEKKEKAEKLKLAQNKEQYQAKRDERIKAAKQKLEDEKVKAEAAKQKLEDEKVKAAQWAKGAEAKAAQEAKEAEAEQKAKIEAEKNAQETASVTFQIADVPEPTTGTADAKKPQQQQGQGAAEEQLTSSQTGMSPIPPIQQGMNDEQWKRLKANVKERLPNKYEDKNENEFTLGTGTDKTLIATRNPGDETVNVKLQIPKDLTNLTVLVDEAAKVYGANRDNPMPVNLSGSEEQTTEMFHALKWNGNLNIKISNVPKDIKQEYEEYKQKQQAASDETLAQQATDVKQQYADESKGSITTQQLGDGSIWKNEQENSRNLVNIAGGTYQNNDPINKGNTEQATNPGPHITPK